MDTVWGQNGTLGYENQGPEAQGEALPAHGRTRPKRGSPSQRSGGWRFRYRLHGKLEKVALGHYPDVSLKDARQKRDEMAGQVARGQSPAREKQLAKLALGTNSSVREFAERYYTDVVVRSLKDPRGVRRYLDNQIFPAFGNKALKDVTAADVQTLVFRKRDNGREAAAAAIRSLIKRLFDYAIVRGAAQVNPALALPMRFINKSQVQNPHVVAR